MSEDNVDSENVNYQSGESAEQGAPESHVSEPQAPQFEAPQTPVAATPEVVYPTAAYWSAPQAPYWHGQAPYAGQPTQPTQPVQPVQPTQPVPDYSSPHAAPYGYGQPYDPAAYASYPQAQQPGQAQWPYGPSYAPVGYGQPYWAPAPAPAKRSRRPFVLAGVGAAVVAGGIAIALTLTSGTGTISGSSFNSLGQGTANSGSSNGSSNGSSSGSGSTGGGSSTDPFGGSDPFSGGTGSGSSGSGSGSTGSGTNTGNGTGLASATAAQQVGVVDIDTVLKYQGAKAAGTGMILSSNGEILTNNHVVQGATSIQVTVVSTGKTYTATVVGTDPTDDVALIKVDASGLQTIKTSSATVNVGDSVTGVGNAQGAGGTPSASPGTVTALNQTITASDESGANPETLNGLIETDAGIEPGDSGGPLFNASNQVIGMDTAASASGNQTASQTTAGYAIQISKAIGIAQQMAAGKASSTIHLGYPAFLGIGVSSTSGSGATISSVVDGLPAAQAGLVAGDTITALGSATINTANDLSAAMLTHAPGDKVSLTYTDSSGASHTVTVTLVQGPAL